MISAVRGAVREDASGLVIELRVADCAAGYAWLAKCALGSGVDLHSASASPPIAAKAPSAPSQVVGLDGIDSAQAGAASLPAKDAAVYRWAAVLATTAPFQAWVEQQAQRDPSVSSIDHARGWLLLQCGARHPVEIVSAQPKLRAIADAYRQWYKSTHPGGDPFASVPPCELA